MDPSAPTGESSGSDIFPLTQWTVLEAAKTVDLEKRKKIVTGLGEKYSRPVRLYVRCWKVQETDADQITKDFFADRFERVITRARREKGKFRKYLRRSVKNYVNTWLRKRGLIAKREVSLEDLRQKGFEPSAPAGPRDVEFDRIWAKETVLGVVDELGRSYADKGQDKHFALFFAVRIAPMLHGVSAPGLTGLASKFGLAMKTADGMITAARRAFQVLLRQEIMTYAGSEAEVPEEMQAICDLFIEACEESPEPEWWPQALSQSSRDDIESSLQTSPL